MAKEDLKYLEKFERDREKRINKNFPSLGANKMKPKKDKNQNEDGLWNEDELLSPEEMEKQMKPFHELNKWVKKNRPGLLKKLMKEIDK